MKSWTSSDLDKMWCCGYVCLWEFILVNKWSCTIWCVQHFLHFSCVWMPTYLTCLSKKRTIMFDNTCWDSSLLVLLEYSLFFMLWVTRAKFIGSLSHCVGHSVGWFCGCCSKYLHYQWSSLFSVHFRKELYCSIECSSPYMWMPYRVSIWSTMG